MAASFFVFFSFLSFELCSLNGRTDGRTWRERRTGAHGSVSAVVAVACGGCDVLAYNKIC